MGKNLFRSGIFTLISCAITVGGCRDPIPTDPDTGLTVSVRLGPIQINPGPGVDNTVPVEGAEVVIRELPSEDVFTTVFTDSQGLARLLIFEGEYEVEVVDCPGSVRLPGPTTVTVREEEFPTVRIECDTGLRG